MTETKRAGMAAIGASSNRDARTSLTRVYLAQTTPTASRAARTLPPT
jgi:hypothetical protein